MSGMITPSGGSPSYAPVEVWRWSVDRLADLLVRPDGFFPALVAARARVFPILVIWIVGAGSVADRMEMRLTLSSVPGSAGSRVPEALIDSWFATWAVVLVGGLVSGLLIWLVFGWWYRIRLILCGARPEKRRVRVVYIHSQLIAGLTSLGVLALQTPFHDDFRDLWATGVIPWGWVLVPLWSAYLGYRAALSCFAVRPVAARVWFLILPAALIGVVVGFLFLMAIVLAL